MRTPLLQVTGLRGFYGAAQALFDIEFEVAQSETVALLGRNGAGKSTSLKAVMGLLGRTEGTIHVMGRAVVGWPPYRIARLGLGYVPEERRLFSELTVAENLEVARQAPRFGPDGRRLAAWVPGDLYRLFPNLGEATRQPAGHLSGGEQQMLAVARTLMGNPLLVLMDEPTEGMAPLMVKQMEQMIVELKERGVSVLLSEQNVDFAQSVCDRGYVLEEGQIRHHGTMPALLEREAVRRSSLSI